MPISSMQIQQMMMQQNAMFAGNMQYAQQLSAPMQQSMYGAAPAPWQVPAYAMPHAAAPYGERLATGMASFASNVAAPTFMGGMALAGGLGMLGRAGRIFDPFGSAISGGMAGFASGGIAGALGGAALGAAPGYLAMKAMDVYGGAFMGGVQDQSNINSMLRSNFRFYGGSGPMGRGFSQGQMGQIGSILQGTARSDLTTSMGELTQLTQMGAQMGQFNGVRDVQQFSQKFKQMLGTLRTIQDELGGSLTEAMTFMRNANQNGVFRNLDSYAAQMRTAQGTTGMSMDQLGAMAMQGAGLSQMMGGRRAQGAMGALRTASSLGAALSSGVINSEALQAATGATGAEGIQALTGRLMEHTARFSRRAMGRYSIFGMSNAQGTGLDESAVNAMLSGGMSVGELSRSAHRNVGRMGRDRAINNEGLLRGALLEQGGLAGQIGVMRMAIGDRVLDQGDDRASLWMQRRMGMSRPEAEILTSLMRNQSAIAQQESIARVGSRRETAMQREIQEHRSMDSFFAHMGHALEEGSGVALVRESGRRFMTRMSQLSEKVMNRLLGIAESTMSAGESASISRYSLGMASNQDLSRMSRVLGANMGSGADRYNLRSQGLFETGPSLDRMLRNRGIDTEGRTRADGSVDGAWSRAQIRGIEDARRGQLTLQSDIASFGRINATTMMRARMLAIGAHERMGADVDAAYYAALDRQGITANAADAYNAQNRIDQITAAPNQMSLMGRSLGLSQERDAMARGALGGAARGAARGAAAGAFLGPVAFIGAGIGAVVGGIGGALQVASANTPQENAAAFIARGGHLGKEAAYNASRAERVAAYGANLRVQGGGRAGDVARDQADLAQSLRVSQESIQNLLNSDDFKDRMSRLQGMSPAEQGRELERMALWAQQGGTEEERRTRMSVVMQMRRNHRTTGSVGREFQVGGGASPADTQRALEATDARASFLEKIGGGFGRAAARMRDIQTQWSAGNQQGVDSAVRESEEAYRQRVSELSGMSRAELNTQLSDMRRNLGQNASEDDREAFNAFEQDIMRRQGVRERLGGRGRRGRVGAQEEAWNLLTGGNVQGVTVGEGRNQRTITNRRQIMEQLRRSARTGGAEFTDLVRQLHRDSGSGMTEEAFSNLVRETATAGGRFAPELQRKLEAAGEDPAVRERSRRALEAQQAARDPLGQRQVELLERIATNTAAAAGAPENGVNPSEVMSGGRR